MHVVSRKLLFSFACPFWMAASVYSNTNSWVSPMVQQLQVHDGSMPWWVHTIQTSFHSANLFGLFRLWLTCWPFEPMVLQCAAVQEFVTYTNIGFPFSNLHWAFWTFILLFVSPVAKSKWFVRKYELYSTTIINRRLEVFQERKFRTDSIANLKQKFKNVLNARSRLGKTSCLKQS